MGGKKQSARSLRGNGGTLLSPLVCPLEVLRLFWPVRPSHWACNPRQLLPDFRPGLTQTGAKVRSNWSGTHFGRFQFHDFYWACSPPQFQADFRPGLTQTGAKVT